MTAEENKNTTYIYAWTFSENIWRVQTDYDILQEPIIEQPLPLTLASSVFDSHRWIMSERQLQIDLW